MRPSCAAASATSSSTPASSRTAPSSTTSPPCRGCSAGTLGARASEPWRCSIGSVWTPPTPAATPPNSPAASSNASVWPGRWRPTRRCCSWTSPSRPSTPWCASNCRPTCCDFKVTSPRRSSSSPMTSTRRSPWATRLLCCGSAADWPKSTRPNGCSPIRSMTSSPTSWAVTGAIVRSGSRPRRGSRWQPSPPSRWAPPRSRLGPRPPTPGSSLSTPPVCRSAGSSRRTSPRRSAASTCIEGHRGASGLPAPRLPRRSALLALRPWGHRRS